MSDNLPAVRETGNVPALASTPALAAVSVEDVVFDKLYRGEKSAELVDQGVMPLGSLFVASSPDDPEARLLVENADAENTKGKLTAKPVLMHVLRLEKSKSGKVDGVFQSFPFTENTIRQDDGKRLDTVYTFIAALPEVDDEMPIKVHMSRTSAGCAKRIITRLLRTGGATHEIAFALRLRKRQKQDAGGKTYRWYVFEEEFIEAPKKAHIEIANRLAQRIAARPVEADIERSANAEPRI